LRTFFEELEREGKTNQIPSTIKFNLRNVPYSYLFGTRHCRKGILGMDLPVQKPSIKQFIEIRNRIHQTQRHQAIVYIMSIIQIRFDFLTTAIPSIWLKLIINFLSKKFSLSISEVYGIDEFEPVDFKTYYKAEIEDVIYFRTPQSNNSASLTIQRFKDKIRMNLMCDSSIENYSTISKSFKSTFLKIPLIKRV
jgi:WS/DGAT C-terminal domain